MRLKCFNTASGRCCCNSESADMEEFQARFNTASGRCCCNVRIFNKETDGLVVVSIPQAVGAVATDYLCDWPSFRQFQYRKRQVLLQLLLAPRWSGAIYACFNTASGRCCCNRRIRLRLWRAQRVSIPQAVGAVATFES